MIDIAQHIIHKLQNSDHTAIDLIYDNYGANLYGLIYKIVGDEEIAKDVMQDAFVKIWKKSHTYDPKKAKLFTWLLNICRNQAIDKLRSLNRNKRNKIQMEAENVNTYKVVQLNEEHMDLQEQVEKLEDKYKEVVEYLFFQGYTQAEASKKLGIPLGTVKSRLKIAVRELQKIFQYKKNVISILAALVWMIR